MANVLKKKTAANVILNEAATADAVYVMTQHFVDKLADLEKLSDEAKSHLLNEQLIEAQTQFKEDYESFEDKIFNYMWDLKHGEVKPKNELSREQFMALGGMGVKGVLPTAAKKMSSAIRKTGLGELPVFAPGEIETAHTSTTASSRKSSATIEPSEEKPQVEKILEKGDKESKTFRDKLLKFVETIAKGFKRPTEDATKPSFLDKMLGVSHLLKDSPDITPEGKVVPPSLQPEVKKARESRRKKEERDASLGRKISAAFDTTTESRMTKFAGKTIWKGANAIGSMFSKKDDTDKPEKVGFFGSLFGKKDDKTKGDVSPGEISKDKIQKVEVVGTVKIEPTEKPEFDILSQESDKKKDDTDKKEGILDTLLEGAKKFGGWIMTAVSSVMAMLSAPLLPVIASIAAAGAVIYGAFLLGKKYSDEIQSAIEWVTNKIPGMGHAHTAAEQSKEWEKSPEAAKFKAEITENKRKAAELAGIKKPEVITRETSKTLEKSAAKVEEAIAEKRKMEVATANEGVIQAVNKSTTVNAPKQVIEQKQDPRNPAGDKLDARGLRLA